VERVDGGTETRHHDECAEDGLDCHEQNEEQGRTHEVRPLAVMVPHVRDGRENGGDHDDRAGTVREVNGDRSRPDRRQHVAERQRKRGNRHPGPRVPHGRAQQNLDVDDRRGCRGDAAEHRVVGDRRSVAPAARREQRETQSEAEEQLGECRVAD
jgi:hypothetical protein